MDVDKLAIEDLVFDQTSIKAVARCIFFATLKGLPTLDIDIKALFVQLYNTFSLRASIELFTNSSDGEEKTNLPLLEELPSGTLTR